MSYTLFPPPGQGRGQRLMSPEYGHAGGEPASRIGGSAIAAGQISRYGPWDAERALPMRQSAVGRLCGSAALRTRFSVLALWATSASDLWENVSSRREGCHLHFIL